MTRWLLVVPQGVASWNGVCYIFSIMKKGVHPEFYAKAKTTCTTCGSVFAIPNTIKEQTVEICRNCHPVYTGKQQKERRGGRIERFRKRLEAAKGGKKA